MTGPIGDYLRELERLLRERGCDDPRIVGEAREHLVDAAEDAVRRGLAREHAEREAIERFGPTTLIAAQAWPGRARTMTTLAAAVETVAGQWRAVTAATAVAALLTSAVSYYFLPTRYRSEIVIGISNTSPHGAEASRESMERLQTISNTVLSGQRLETVAKDFGLDKRPDGSGPIADTVQQMRRNISIELGQPRQVTVGFQSTDARTAMRVAERIASMFIEANLQQRETTAGGFLPSQMLDSEIEDVRFRLAREEAQIEAARARNIRLWRTDLVPFEVLQDRYRNLLAKREDERLASRMFGEQYRVLKGAQVPDRPVGPSRASVNLTGTLAGLTIAVATTLVRWKNGSDIQRAA